MKLSWIFYLMMFQWAGSTAENQDAEFAAKLQAYYATVKTIQADFVQEKESALFDDPLVSKGKFYFEKPGQVRWEQVVPTKNYFIFKSNEFIHFDGKTVKKSATVSPQMLVFKDFILKTVDGSILQDAAFSKTFRSEKGKMHIQLIPVEKRLSKRLERIELVFDEKTLLLDHLEMTEISQEITRISFEQQEVNSPISSAIFAP